MIRLNPWKLNTTMYLVVLLNLTGMLYQTIVKASQGDYNNFLITSSSTDELSNTDGPAIMKIKETACEKDIRIGFLGVHEKIYLYDLYMLQIKWNYKEKKADIEFIKLSDLNKMDKMSKKNLYDYRQDVVVIIPGYKTSIKRDAPESIVKLIYTLATNAENINIFVFDIGEHFSKKHTYEECVLKVSTLGRYLGQNLAKLRPSPVRKLHLIGIDIGASVSGITAKYYEIEKHTKITRISAINPATLCVKNFLTKNSAVFVDVYIASNLYNDDIGKIGTVNYQIRDKKDKSSCSRLPCSTTKAVNYFTDSILKTNNKFKLFNCSNDSCTDEVYTKMLKYGYYLDPKQKIETAEEYQILYANSEETEYNIVV